MQLLTLIVITGQLLLARSLLYEEYPILETYIGAVPQYVEDKLLSVGIVVYEDDKLTTVGENFNIGYYTAAKGNTLCDQNFADKDSYFLAGTGFIIGSNQFVTAYHVPEYILKEHNFGVDSKTVKKLRIIFNFRQKKTGVLEDSITYAVKTIVRENKDTDWIVLRTTKGFTHTPVTKFALAKDIPLAGTPVYVLGHPLGMPLRYAEGQLAKYNSQNQIAVLTSGFAGNSGSPVITEDGKVVGLFCYYADGDNNANDFVKSKSGSCYDLAITSVENPVLVNGPAARIIRPNWLG
eukprot:Em0007g36a